MWNFVLCISLSKWIQLQYGGKCYSNLGTFPINQLGRTSSNMSLDGANYVQDYPKLFFEVEETMQERFV
jgi:hypothetical protein